jgi:natural product biosynthesis luciferase-like monooxygenase protein
VDFSLFYFADDSSIGDDDYRLLLEGARFADRHGFTAVWTPERHFHEFGGQYPNPSVVGAALAVATERIGIRAGSVVAPLHHPMRIAEEWSVVDRLSNGRAGVSFASGWHGVDFVLRPENYQRRKEVLADTVHTVRRLWKGEQVAFPGSDGELVPVGLYPRPVQRELPIWLTSAGSVETFRTAGDLGVGVLTHLLGQEPEDLAGKIAAYRAAFVRTSDPAKAHVTLMLHSMLGTDRDAVREQVREPFSAYLRSSISLIAKAAGAALPSGFDPAKLAPEDREFLVARSFDRYFDTGGLFGTVDDAIATVRRISALGVDEIACLIDFGVPTDDVLAGLRLIDEVRRACGHGDTANA